MSSTSAANPLLQTFARGEPIALDAPFGFACRGCGHRCCVNTDVLVSPPEAARIIWYLERHPELAALKNSSWGELLIGGATGLPLMRLNFIALNDETHYCPFLMPVCDERHTWPRMAWCGIREARPAVCRIFPLGRMAATSNQTKQGNALDYEYRIVERCPGFEAAPDDQVPPDYTPPNHQTVRAWLAKQIDLDQEAEKNFYIGEVLPAFMRAQLHAPTENSPDGLLTEGMALKLGHLLFYNPPPRPFETRQDHAVIMVWLKSMLDVVPIIQQTLTPSAHRHEIKRQLTRGSI